MRYEVWDSTGTERLAVKNGKPTHEDLCERCNECLLCCGRQRCETAKRENDSPYRHLWRQYVELAGEQREGGDE